MATKTGRAAEREEQTLSLAEISLDALARDGKLIVAFRTGEDVALETVGSVCRNGGAIQINADSFLKRTICNEDGHEYQYGECVTCHAAAPAQELALALHDLMDAEGGESGEGKEQRRAWRRAKAALRKAGY